MKVKMWICVLLGFVFFAGCRERKSESYSTQTCYRGEPSSREEALMLMRDLDQEADESDWEVQVLGHMRKQMRGRLLAAGLDDVEVDAWVQSEK